MWKLFLFPSVRGSDITLLGLPNQVALLKSTSNLNFIYLFLKINDMISAARKYLLIFVQPIAQLWAEN